MALPVHDGWAALRASSDPEHLHGGERGRCRICGHIFAKRFWSDALCAPCDERRWSAAPPVPPPARFIGGIGMVPYETPDRWLTTCLNRVDADNARMEREGASGFPAGPVRP
jgi:hypothetical protein